MHFPVSIPYRYATNDKRKNLNGGVAKVSIPYRYATNPDWAHKNRSAQDKFQSLIGTLQTGCNIQGTEKAARVSIPYRYATNQAIFSRLSLEVKVSIPYRYATNKILHEYLQNFLEFQSLIGTLQTNDSWFRIRIYRKFQSLIGTLQTSTYSNILICECVFQSLIGTLQTIYTSKRKSAKEKVSIPYRYATNANIKKVQEKYKMFQSLIGTLQTIL